MSQYTTPIQQNLIDQKKTIRENTLAKRNALPESQRIEMSLATVSPAMAAIDMALSPSLQEQGNVVAGFLPIRSEIDPRPLMTALATAGARLCVPVIIDKTTIVFRQLIRGAPLVECGFGTFGPDENTPQLDPNILLIPLSAYDKNGGRIGYGGGFYDRAIEKLIQKGKTPQLHGIAYSVQEVDNVPMEPHDRYLDGIITENGYIKADRP